MTTEAPAPPDHAYIGKIPGCGCIVAAVVDGYISKKDIAKEVADFIKRGYDVERVLIGPDGIGFTRCTHR